MMIYRLKIFFACFLSVYLFAAAPLRAEEINPKAPVMGMYTKPPAILASGAPPSVMLMFDNSGSMYKLAYQPQVNNFESTTEYYGLFKPRSYYKYIESEEVFERCEDSTASGCEWNGNFLNWLTMRRIDVSKKVLTGGRLVKDGDYTRLTAEPGTDRDLGDGKSVVKRFAYDDSAPVEDLNGDMRHMTPYARNYIKRDLDIYDYGEIVFNSDDPDHIVLWFKTADSAGSWHGVYVEIKLSAEEASKVKGIIQETASDVRYGLTVFDEAHSVDDGRWQDAEGGIVKQYVGAKTQDIVDAINDTVPGTWTPLAETLYTITGYFAQKVGEEKGTIIYEDEDGNTLSTEVLVGSQYYGTDSYQINKTWDAFFFNDKDKIEACSKAFVIILTDGLPTKDMSIPSRFRDFDGDDKEDSVIPRYINHPTDYLDDIALYAHTTDLRSDIEGTQNLTIYPIFVFGSDPLPPPILFDTAINGGFDDKNGNGSVDLDDDEVTYDPMSTMPSNLFNARNGKELVTALRRALTDIKNATSSPASVAVMNNSVDGSGATFQSLYLPSMKDDNEHTVGWAGDVRALQIDSYGNLREDTNHNQQLDMVDDLIIEYKTDSDGKIMISMFKDQNGNGTLEETAEVEIVDASGVATTITVNETEAVEAGLSLDNIAYLWSGGNWLSHLDNNQIQTQRSSYLSNSGQRYIHTYIDRNNNGKVDIGEYLPFTTGSLAADDKYLGYFLGTNSGDGRDLNGDTAVNTDDLTILIDYIRGKEFESATYPLLRSRKYESPLVLGEDGVDKNAIWRLGDIVSSSPIAVQTPFAGYDTTYNSKSYRRFKRKYAERRTVIYTGSNDGVFHAFNGGFFQKDYEDTTGTRIFNKYWKKCEKNDDTGAVTCSDTDATAPALGQEMWAYIPQNLLPHLQWLPQKDYQHVFYNDLPPTIFEAQLWKKDDPVHIDGWGTILVGGMRFGGGPIEVEAKVLKADGSSADEKRIMRSAYFVMDITDPELPPVLLDEFTLDTDERATFSTVQPSLEYVTINMEEEIRDWYLVFGSGPETLKGESNHKARVFVRKLESLPLGAGQTTGTQQYADFGPWVKKSAIAAEEFHLFEVQENKSFIGNFFGADFHIGTSKGAFSTDAIYFGTVAGEFKEWISGADKGEWTGKLHRIVVQSGSNNPADTATWKDKILFDAKAPISVKPQVTLDEMENAWIYFGTGRFIHPLHDKEDTSPKMSLYGIKESMVENAKLGIIPHYMGDQITAAVLKSELIDSTRIRVYAGSTADKSEVRGAGAAHDTFDKLEEWADSKQGWFVDLAQTDLSAKSVEGERLIVNPVIYSKLVNFNSFIPSTNICEVANSGYIYNFYYKTGTSFWRPIMGVDETKTITTVGDDGETITQFLAKSRSEVNSFLSSSSFASGEGGAKQLVGADGGAVKEYEVSPPGRFKSGRLFWLDKRE